MDNTLLVQEITHDEKKSWTRRKWLGIKIDFEKNFDRLEWVRTFWSPWKTFTAWIKECISSPSFSAMINMLCSIVLSVGSQYGGERISLDVFLHKLSLTAYEHFSVLSSIPNEHTVEMEPHHQAKSYLDPNVFLNNRFIIINTDASFSDGRVGKAGIVRNRETNPTSWFQQSAALSAIQAEARSVLTAIRVAKERNWKHQLLLSDCYLLVLALQHRVELPWEIASICHDIEMAPTQFCWMYFWKGR